MKQFIVDRHTTPNTPTLEQVPTEKVPVYESLAAAESDLDNLTVGQIVATTDTGDELAQPVDVVEEGNLHAVTSNAVAESIGRKALFSNSITTTATSYSLSGKLSDYDYLQITACSSDHQTRGAIVLPIDIITAGFVLPCYYGGAVCAVAGVYVDDTHIKLNTTNIGVSECYLYGVKARTIN